jgi:SAM-dependent methyltransferase
MLRVAGAILKHPFTYRALHTITGLRLLHAKLLRDVLRPCDDGSTLEVLDLGCGPGDTLNLLGQNVNYTGIDLNEKYVSNATRRCRRAASFVLGDITRLDLAQFRAFDLIIAFGLIHHLSDREADDLLSVASRMLKPTGRLITLDGCHRDDNSLVIRWLLEHDRGLYVRREQQYLALFARYLQVEKIVTDPAPMRIPYAILSIVARPKHLGGERSMSCP